MIDSRRKQHILDAAALAVGRTTGLKVCLRQAKTRADRTPDSSVVIWSADKKHNFLAEVTLLQRFEVFGMIQIHANQWDQPPLVVAPYVSREAAAECKQRGLPFMDTAGNCFLEAPGLLVYVVGQPRTAEPKPASRELTSAALQVAFALLSDPDLLNATYREIATGAKVALGSIGPVLSDLESRGFLAATAGGKRRLPNPSALVEEWVAQYPGRLRRKLNPRRFEGDIDRLLPSDLTPYRACWSGEVAAHKLSGELHPRALTIYAPQPAAAALVADLGLGEQERGEIEVLQTFWDFPSPSQPPDVAPPLVIYADLLIDKRPWNLAIANNIYEQWIKPAFTAAG